MNDQQILDNLDFIHKSGLGRGGYSIHLSPSMQLYEDNVILYSFEGEYVNPIGPFQKWVYLSSAIYSSEKEYWLSFRKDFWRTCSEQDCIELYIKPFLFLLRKLVSDQIDSRSILQNYDGYSASVRNLADEKKEYFHNLLSRVSGANSLY